MAGLPVNTYGERKDDHYPCNGCPYYWRADRSTCCKDFCCAYKDYVSRTGEDPLDEIAKLGGGF